MNCVFSGLSYPAWVENENGQTKIKVIPSDIYRKLHEAERSVRNFTLDVLSARIFNLMSSLKEVSLGSLEQRVASLLLRKAGKTGHVVISHERIAEHLGTAREVISRILKKFSETGYVELFRGYVEIKSIDGLQDVLHRKE